MRDLAEERLADRAEGRFIAAYDEAVRLGIVGDRAALWAHLTWRVSTGDLLLFFARHGPPGRRVVQYARALARLRWIEARWATAELDAVLRRAGLDPAALDPNAPEDFPRVLDALDRLGGPR